MAEEIESKRIPQLPPLSLIDGGMKIPVYNPADDTTYRTDLSNIISATEKPDAWADNIIYDDGDIVSYNDAVYVSSQADNFNHIPLSSPSFWNPTPQITSGIKAHAIGVYTGTDVIVTYTSGGVKALYSLEVATPFNSTNFVTELAAAKWKMVGVASKFRGGFTSLANLQASVPVGTDGEYAKVDAGPGTPATEYIWDADDGWVLTSGISNSYTNALEKLADVVKWKGPLMEDTLISGDFRMMFLNKLFDLSTTGNLIKFYGQGEANYKPLDFTTGTGFNDNNVRNMIEDPDGKIVFVGRFEFYNGVAANRIIRLNRNGSIDTSFLSGTAFASASDILDIKKQSTGKYIVIGAFTSYNGTAKTGIVRLNQDGTVDNTFISGTGLSGFTTWGAIAIQSDDKIIVVGPFTTYNAVSTPRILRLEVDGALDTTFDTNVGTGFNTVSSVGPTGVDVDSTGKIYVIGNFTTFNGLSRNKIARLNSDGTADTFIVGTGLNVGPSGIAIQSDNKVVLGGGFTSYNGTTVNKMVRLNTDGTIDNTFVNGSDSTSVLRVTVLPSGKILAVIAWQFGAIQNKGVILLTSTGDLDPTFNPATTGYDEAIFFAKPLLNGEIITGGIFTGYNGETFNRVLGFTNKPMLIAKAPLGITYEDNYPFSEGRSIPDVAFVQSEFGVYETVSINSVNQLTLDMQYLGRASGEKTFIVATPRTSDFSISFINTSNIRNFSLHIPITGTVTVTLPTAVVTSQGETRFNNVAKTLVLTGTASPFELSFTKVGALYKLEASTEFYAS